MFTTLSTWYPTPGKEGEMLALGTEFVKALQARGEQYSLVTRLYSPIGSAITLNRRFRDMAEIEAAQEQNRADKSFHQAVAKASALSRAPSMSRLWEVLLPMSGTGAAKFTQTTVIFPAVGNLGEVRALLTESVRGDQARYRIGLSTDAYNADGQVFVVTGVYASLSEVAERRDAHMADHAWVERVTKVSKLCHKPAQYTLNAIVVPYPQ